MEKLNQLRNLLRPTSTLLAGAGGEPCRGLATFLREPRRRFSTESEQREDATVDNFFETPDTGAAYRKLLGITKQTLKSDVINLLDECKLSLDDIRVNYDRSFAPIGMDELNVTRDEFDVSRDEFDVARDEFNVIRDELNVTRDEFDMTRDDFDVTRDEFDLIFFSGTQMMQFAL
ncbi:hypothetical protein CRG98_018608 [Punica granatum]|uniref:Uncharacterized protein n=1 Tax=Punica granatum TaxID=22663 RepID=A0A2I0JXC3_PUNGR|nr:hypothetical protein CRG98_018608 [Punica granatum]